MRIAILALLAASTFLPHAAGAPDAPTATLSITAGHSNPFIGESTTHGSDAVLRVVVFDQVVLEDSDATESWSRAGPVTIPGDCAATFRFATVDGSPPQRISYDEGVVPDEGPARMAQQHTMVELGFDARGEIVLRLGLWRQVQDLVSCALRVSPQPLGWDVAQLEVSSFLGSSIDPDSVRPHQLRRQVVEQANGLMDDDGTIRQEWSSHGLRFNGQDLDRLRSQELRFRLAPTTAPPNIPTAWILVGLFSLGTALALSTEHSRFRLRTIALALGFTRLSRDTALDHSTREELVEFVNRNPGASFGEIRRGLGIGHGTMAHHLRILRTQGLVQTRRDGTRCRVFPRNMPVPVPLMGVRDGSLRQAVLELVGAEPGLTTQAIAQRLNASRRTVAHHLQRLRALGLVQVQRRSRWLTYRPASGGSE